MWLGAYWLRGFQCHGSHFTLRSALAHVHTPYLYLRNGLTDCAQICCEFVTQSAVTQSVCGVGGLHGGRFARWAVCTVGGLRDWRFAQLAVCAVGGLRGGWRFSCLAVCAVGGLRGWRCDVRTQPLPVTVRPPPPVTVRPPPPPPPTRVTHRVRVVNCIGRLAGRRPGDRSVT